MVRGYHVYEYIWDAGKGETLTSCKKCHDRQARTANEVALSCVE